MPDDKVPGGNNAEAGGQSADEAKTKKDVVSYDTHTKVLDEKKALKRQLDEYQTKLKEIEEKQKEADQKKLEEQGAYKELLENERKEKAKLESQLTEFKGSLETAAKRAAVLKNLNGQIPDKYQFLVDVSKVVIDSETGDVDMESAKLAAKAFEAEHGILLSSGGSAKLPPQDAARGGTRKLTVAEWKALGSAKKMKEAYKDVDFNT